MNNTPVNPKPNRLKVLSFLGVVLFEIVFVMTSLLLFFGTLNYFNIFPVSDTFPKYFGWLPRKDVPNGTSQKTQTNTPVNSSLQNPIPSPTQIIGFQYDTKKAELLFAKYIKDTVKTTLIPIDFKIKQGQSIDGNEEDIKYEFGSQFKVNDTTALANFHFTENTNNPNDYIIFIQLKNIEPSTSTSSSFANSLLSSYFNNPYHIDLCKTKGSNSICESLKKEADGKRGYGLLFTYDGNKFVPILFTCFVPKESDSYDALESCIRM